MEQDRLNNLTQYHRHKGDHFEAIRSLLDYLEIDFYSEPARRELDAYRRDLELLSSALRTVKSVNALVRRESLPADRLLDESAVSGPAAARIRDAGASLSAMREKGELRLLDGTLAVAWARTYPVDAAVVASLRERAGLFLDVAAAEIGSGEAQRAVPECSR